MNKKISFEDIVKRLNSIRTDLFLDESTYVGTHYKARFFFTDGSSNPTGNAAVMLKRNINNTKKYGTAHVMQVPAVALKSAKNLNNSTVKIHWKTSEELVCQASYESKVVDYLNFNKIDFMWQPQVFKIPNGKTYRPDMFLINENKWIEIKGFMRPDAQEKWFWFKNKFLNSELWDRNKLKSLGIL